MYIIHAVRKPAGTERGFVRRDNQVIVTVSDDEALLREKLNELVNEGTRGEQHEIKQIIWRPS